MQPKTKTFQRLFTFSIILKALDGIIQLTGGVLFVLLKKEGVLRDVSKLLHTHFFKIPNPDIERWMVYLSNMLTSNVETLIALILIGNGIAKVILSVNILMKKMWAFVAALIFLTLLLIYQFAKAFYFHSLVFNLFNILDLIVVLIIFMQYKYLKEKKGFR